VTRLLLDQGLAPLAAAILREQGFDAVHVWEIGMHRSEDIQFRTLRGMIRVDA
jgi:predicted nuclease of predicted toxin-antitoxin system